MVQTSLKRSLAVVLMVTCAALLLLAPVAQARPRSWTVPAPWVEAPCDGVNAPDGQDNSYKGFLIPRSAALGDDGVVRMRARLQGGCGVDDGEVYSIATTIRSRVKVASPSCDGFTMRMPDKTKDGITIHFSDALIRIASPAGGPEHYFCSLAKAVEVGNKHLIASKLDAIFQLLTTEGGVAARA